MDVRSAGRAAASLLHVTGLQELVCSNLQEYETLALKLALAPAELTAIRRKLEANRLTYPLFDTDHFRRHIEAAYWTMWEIRRGTSRHVTSALLRNGPCKIGGEDGIRTHDTALDRITV